MGLMFHGDGDTVSHQSCIFESQMQTHEGPLWNVGTAVWRGHVWRWQGYGGGMDRASS